MCYSERVQKWSTSVWSEEWSYPMFKAWTELWWCTGMFTREDIHVYLNVEKNLARFRPQSHCVMEEILQAHVFNTGTTVNTTIIMPSFQVILSIHIDCIIWVFVHSITARLVYDMVWIPLYINTFSDHPVNTHRLYYIICLFTASLQAWFMIWMLFGCLVVCNRSLTCIFGVRVLFHR